MSAALTSSRLRFESLEEYEDPLETNAAGDGLPTVPPTPERVQRSLDFLGRNPAEVVAVLPPSRGIATVEKVVINAVMAGARPEAMPLVIAAVDACADPALNLETLQVTSNPATTLIVVNGPARISAGINSAGNSFAQGGANLAVGRAVRLVLANIGGARPYVNDMACQGFPGKLAFCFGENEEASPWDPWHVERGLPAGMGAVTVVGSQGTSNIAVHGRGDARDVMLALTNGMINPGANNFCTGGGEPMIVLNPGHAGALERGGIGKDAFREYVFENARVPLDWYSAAAIEARHLEKRSVDGRVLIADDPGDIIVIVSGAPGTHSTFIPSYGDTKAITRAVSSVER